MPQVIFPELTDRKLVNLQKQAATKREFQRVQCLYLRKHGATSKGIAAALALSAISVKRVWSDYRKHGEENILKDKRGGRYRQNMTAVEEQEFLAPFFQKAARGELLIVNGIKDAYEKKLKRPVPKSTIYAMLHRHGWRKITPRPTHPKGNASSREIFKVSFPPNRSYSSD